MEWLYGISKYLNPLILITGAAGLYLALKRNKEKSDVCGSMVIAMGVLGTFIGISKGLSVFNVNEIENSIPGLLNGMKFAFETSILGMMISILLKFINEAVEKFKASNEDEEIDNVEDLFNSLLSEMKSLNYTLQQNQDKTDDIVLKLGKAFEENQNKLNLELKELSTSLNKKQDILISEFREFGERMAHNNTTALIEALEGVIKEFNYNLTEQFGENFKELNIAVSKLLEWQEYYKETVEINTKQLKITVDSIKSIDNALTNISSSSDSLIKTSDSINESLRQVAFTQGEVRSGISSIIDVSNQAKESIPALNKYFENSNSSILKSIEVLDRSLEAKLVSINKYIEDLSKSINEASIESMDEITQTLNHMNLNINQEVIKYVNELEELTKAINNTIPSISDEMNKNYSLFTNTLKSLSIDTNNVLRLSTEQIKSNIETIMKANSDMGDKLQLLVEEINESTSKQIVKIVEQMEKLFLDRSNQVSDMLEHELKESLNSLGTQLATLSGKFVEDYTPLTERLREVVSIAQGV